MFDSTLSLFRELKYRDVNFCQSCKMKCTEELFLSVSYYYELINSYLQIRQYRRLEDGSVNVVTRGQQRFRLRRRWDDVEGVVRILSLLQIF